jgi:hypothetical protein
MDMILECNENSSLFWPLSDDVRLTQKNWDKQVLNCAKEYHSELFIIHTHRVDRLEDLDIHQAIQECEGFPIFSKAWLFTQQGRFSVTGHLDSWTAATELLLFQKYKIDHRIELIPHILERIITKDTDGVGSKRWNTTRREMLTKVLEKNSYDILESNVDNIYMKIMNEKNIKKFSYEINQSKINNYSSYLIHMMLNVYDKYLIERQKNEGVDKKTLFQKIKSLFS